MQRDTIFIRDLHVKGKHGVSDEERTNPQDFIVDISVSFDTRQSAATDNLAHTLDYGEFRKVAAAVIEGASVHLMERLAEKIAEGVLADTRVRDVTVTIRKPKIYADCVPGITIIRTRA